VPEDGETALHVAIRHNYLSIAKLLLRQGINPNAENKVAAVLQNFSVADGESK